MFLQTTCEVNRLLIQDQNYDSKWEVLKLVKNIVQLWPSVCPVDFQTGRKEQNLPNFVNCYCIHILHSVWTDISTVFCQFM